MLIVDAFQHLRVQCRLQALRDTYVPALQRKADSLEADSTHDTQRLEELQADYALLEHELQVSLTPGLHLKMHRTDIMVRQCPHKQIGWHQSKPPQTMRAALEF